MGVKKPATYGGTCAVCNTEYKSGDEVCMQKINDKWIICLDQDCFEKQGGKIEEKKQGKGFVSYKFPISKAPEIYELAKQLAGPQTTDTDEVHMKVTASIFHTLSTAYKEN